MESSIETPLSEMPGLSDLPGSTFFQVDREPGITADRTRAKTSGFRWVICSLLFFATTTNYMDRQIIGVLKPLMQKDLRWSEIDYSNIIFCFQLAYACGGLIAGRLIDRVGVRIGYAVAVGAWSLASMAHGLARSVVMFSTARIGLGLAEGGNFPAAIKTVGEWFPASERALATGIFNAGSNVGAMITPLIVPLIVLRWGWHAAFFWTGSLGFLWVIAWVWIYKKPHRDPLVSVTESQSIQLRDGNMRKSLDPKTTHNDLYALLTTRSTVAYVLAGMLTGPVWWFYLFWAPDFLNKRFHLDLQHLGLPLAMIYLMADVGSVGGGWASSHFIAHGWSVNAARKSVMLICALAVTPVCLVSVTSYSWVGASLLALAAAAHQAWSANLYTFVIDTTPAAAVSTVVGIGGLTGGLAGMVAAKVVGYVLQSTGNYRVLFFVASAMYLLALLALHLLVPRLASDKLMEFADDASFSQRNARPM